MDNSLEIRKIEIEEDTLKYLDKTRKWTMFLAILGFIFIGLLVIIGLFAGVFMSVFNTSKMSVGFPEWIVFAIILVLSVIYFFPVFFLFRFSKHTSNAVKNLDKKELHKALKNLKSYYVYIGILIIIVLSIYIIAFIAAGASMAFLNKLG
jgi:MFS family permease